MIVWRNLESSWGWKIIGSGKGIPEYTQRQLNELFARYILYTEVVATMDADDFSILSHVANDWYILKGEE